MYTNIFVFSEKSCKYRDFRVDSLFPKKRKYWCIDFTDWTSLAQCDLRPVTVLNLIRLRVKTEYVIKHRTIFDSLVKTNAIFELYSLGLNYCSLGLYF